MKRINSNMIHKASCSVIPLTFITHANEIISNFNYLCNKYLIDNDSLFKNLELLALFAWWNLLILGHLCKKAKLRRLICIYSDSYEHIKL